MASGATRLPRLLAIDDDRFVCEVVVRALRGRYDVDIESAASGALRRLCDGNRYEAIVCDLKMPGVSGFELLAHVRRDFPEQARAFMFLTAAPSEALFATGVPFLRKPFHRDDLILFVDAHAIVIGPGLTHAASESGS